MSILEVGEPAPPVQSVVVRRRQVTLVLAALNAGAFLAALGNGSAFAWLVFVMMLGAFASYGALLHRSRTMAALREFGLEGADARRLDDLLGLGVAAYHHEPDFVVISDTAPAWRRAIGLVRFMVCYAAGWALSPLVFALTIAVGKTPTDTTGQRWLANLQAAQVRLKEQSMRTLVVSAATTASVTGAAVVLGGGGVATAASFSSSAPPPAASATGSLYSVQAGDTLSSIAVHFGTTWEVLAHLNGLSDPNVIYPGQELSVPGGSLPATSSSSYRVQAGDTLSSIAARFGTTWERLAQRNGLANPDFIAVGQVISLSGPATSSPAASSTAADPPAASPAADPPPPSAAADPAPAQAATESAAQVAVQTALDQVGKPYQWAGAGPNSFDCSGLVMYAWEKAGFSLPHYSVAQYQNTSRISESQLEPGDLVFYDNGSGAQPGHVAIYTGNGQVVSADTAGTNVRREALTWDGSPIGFGRVG